MLRAFLFLLVLSTSVVAESQAQTAQPLARTTIFGQLGGDGLALSLNVDYMVTPEINVRTGISTIVFASGVPLIVSYHLGAAQHRFEVGAGAFALTSIDDNDRAVWGLVHAGYRYHPRVKQWLFRAGLAVVYDGTDVLPLPGVSIGRGLRLGL
ncbi:MAG: hypothetical protein RhofKO_24720 [Rhodothermales bacterium]